MLQRGLAAGILGGGSGGRPAWGGTCRCTGERIFRPTKTRGYPKGRGNAEEDADVQKIKELIRIMKENDLVKIDIQHGEDRISLQRAEPPQPIPPTGHSDGRSRAHGSGDFAGRKAPAGQAGAAEGTVEIKSPMVGTFYEASSPDSDPYVEIGAHVDPQTVVCIIEAMKVMNEIRGGDQRHDSRRSGEERPGRRVWPSPSSGSSQLSAHVQTCFSQTTPIANRGERALRIIRACHEIVDTVAVYSQADAHSLPSGWRMNPSDRTRQLQ